MLPGVSALGFFYNKSERRWNNADIKDYMIRVLYTDLPAFSILVDVGDVSTTATMKVFSTKEVQLSVTTTLFVGRSDGLASTGGTGQKSVTFPGQTNYDIDSGYYYYEITLSSGLKIYSDVFMVVDSASDLFGITFSSTDILANKNFTLPLHLISSTKFFLPLNSISISSEIKEEGIKVTNHNYPSTTQIGSVLNVDGDAFTDIDILIGGSPCQNLSIAMAKEHRKGLDGDKSGLFYEYYRVLNEVKPAHFLLENVGGMDKKDKDIITELLGVEPLSINSSLV